MISGFIRWKHLAVKEQVNLYQQYRAEHRREPFEKYICHLSNYLNTPCRMQMNWLLQAANFNDCRSHPIAWLSLSGKAEWNEHTAVLTVLTGTVWGEKRKKKKEVLLSWVLLFVMQRTAQCHFVDWRKSATKLLLSEPKRPAGDF